MSWFGREEEGLSFHKWINHFCKTHAGHSSPPVMSTICKPVFPQQRSARMMSVAGMFWILSFDKCSHKSARMFSDPTRGRRARIPGPQHLRTHHLLAWRPGFCHLSPCFFLFSSTVSGLVKSCYKKVHGSVCFQSEAGSHRGP